MKRTLAELLQSVANAKEEEVEVDYTPRMFKLKASHTTNNTVQRNKKNISFLTTKRCINKEKVDILITSPYVQ